MSALFRIIYAAHANGTHHKIALDALNHLGRGDAEAWRRMVLKHVGKYLQGSKDPDNVFKDFKNHVLHVSDNYWGGAPEKVEEWYGKTVSALRAGQWEEAAYSAGVLSHYYSDPIMPFHTGQTEAENAIHRAAEWSINRSYDALRRQGEERHADVEAPVPEGANWLKEYVCDGAEYSHRYYEKLIAHYDITRGSVRPEDGLDSVGRTIVAELLMYAAEGFGNVLDRAISEAGIAAPEVNLSLDTIIATLQIPQKWIEKKLSNAEDRKLVQAMYDELKLTGKVDATLSEDDRTIRDLHAAEILAPKRAVQAKQRASRVTEKPLAQADTAEDLPRRVEPIKPASQTPKTLVLPLPPALPDAAPPEKKDVVIPNVAQNHGPLPKAQTLDQHSSRPVQEPLETVKAEHAVAHHDEQAAIAAPGTEVRPLSPATPTDSRRSYLAKSDDLEAAPSIGPKMAQKFAELGITTVGEFLGQDPHAMAELLDDNRIDAETLVDWQDQAQLVIDIPGLRGTHAQLLVGAGYRTAEAVADAAAVELSADVLKFAATSEGKRILRDGNAPDLEKIKSWVDFARNAIAA